MIKKHWVHFLYNVGKTFEYRADEIVSNLNKVIELRSKIQAIEKEISYQERELLTDVLEEWNIEEVTEARARLKEKL